MNFDIAIIGGGPAGLAAALSAKQNGAKNIVLLRNPFASISSSAYSIFYTNFSVHTYYNTADFYCKPQSIHQSGTVYRMWQM